jgi:hypothetical protein
MAANRPTALAPHALLHLSKTTLADIVWELVGTHPDVTSCDDHAELARILLAVASRVRAPGADLGRLESLIDELAP